MSPKQLPYPFRPSVLPASIPSISAFTILTLLLGIGLFFIAPLGPLYLILVIIAGGYALFRVIPLLKDPCHHDRGIKAFSSLSIFRMAISAAVLLTVLVAQF